MTMSEAAHRTPGTMPPTSAWCASVAGQDQMVAPKIVMVMLGGLQVPLKSVEKILSYRFIVVGVGNEDFFAGSGVFHGVSIRRYPSIYPTIHCLTYYCQIARSQCQACRGGFIRPAV